MTRSRYEAQIRKILEEREHESAIDFDGVPFSYGEARAIVSAVETALSAAGIEEYEKIGLLGRNLPAHFATVWALFVANRCNSMVNAFQPPGALAEELLENRWPMVIGERRDWTEAVVAAANEAGTVGYAFTNDPQHPIERVTASDRPGRGTNRTQDDTVLQLLSSGTTGRPKRISLSRKAVDEMIERTIKQFELAGSTEGATQILPWPISSQGGPNAALPCAVLGQQLAIQEKFNAERILQMIVRYRPPFLSLPPSGLAMVLQLKPPRAAFSSVKLYASGTAPLDPNVRRVLEEEYGVPVSEVYGATEFAGIITGWIESDLSLLSAKRGSVGRALPGIRVRIASQETGAELPVGEIGLVEAMVPRIGTEFVRTNDLGHLDEDGFLFIHGRADDVIFRGSFKVIPEEIAEILRTHPKVGDAALIGIPDERVGTVPAAAIQKRVGTPAPTSEELDAFLRAKLPAYKIPVRFAIVDEIPRTVTMKPRREGLRALFS